MAITFGPWVDPINDPHGQHPSGPYGWQAWLPTIGPATFALWNILVTQLHLEPTVSWDIDTLAAALGLGRETGRNSAIQRTLNRACQFRIMEQLPPDTDSDDEATYLVRLTTPPLYPRRLARLPRHVTTLHNQIWPRQCTG